MAMIVTGPWQLSDITDHHVSYGVQVMPSFGTSHETISGPDVYMVFNHSDERRKAAVTFLSWLQGDLSANTIVDPATRQVRKATDHKDWDVLWASSDGRR